jgi:hypothetical protein
MDDINAQLQAARQRLSDFEEASARANLLARLKASQPAHPFLLARTGAGLGGMALLLGAVALGAAPLFLGRATAITLQQLDQSLGFPMPIALVVLSLCAFAMAVAAHQLALGAARQVPLLPAEGKQHQRYVADVKQLESKLAMEGTPRPTVRVTGR